jgi:small nuclear ribonucleoprotein (snRNP)-like protein
MNREQFKEKILDKLIKVETNEGRIVLGKMKCIDSKGNLFITQTVEVFNKGSDLYCPSKLYENNNEYSFYFDTKDNYYQLYSNCIVPLKEIKTLNILKDS